MCWSRHAARESTAMTTPDPIAPPASGDTTARRRLRWWMVAAPVVVLVGVGALVVSAQGTDGSEASAAPPPRFVDGTADSGVDHAYTGDFDFFVGGGVAAFDCDDDGFPDLYFAGGSSPAALYRNASSTGGTLQFEAVASPVTDLTAVTGAYPIDIDSDGHLDLVVLRHGENQVLRGLGDCRFEPATTRSASTAATTGRRRSAPPGRATTSCRRSRSAPTSKTTGRPAATVSLVRPDGEGYGPPIALTPGYCTLSMLFSDWSRTGPARPASRQRSALLHRRQRAAVGDRPGEPPRLYTESDGWRPLQVWGMGLASRDLTGDRLPEVFITSQGDNKLQSLDSGPASPTYGDIALRARRDGAAPLHRRRCPPVDRMAPRVRRRQQRRPRRSLRVEGQRRRPDRPCTATRTTCSSASPTERSSKAPRRLASSPSRALGARRSSTSTSTGCSIWSWSTGRPPLLWRNVGAVMARRRTDGPLARDRTRPTRPERRCHRCVGRGRNRGGDDRSGGNVGAGHVGGKAGWIHAGLGAADSAKVRVTWPDGEVGDWVEVDADQFVTIGGRPTHGLITGCAQFSAQSLEAVITCAGSSSNALKANSAAPTVTECGPRSRSDHCDITPRGSVAALRQFVVEHARICGRIRANNPPSTTMSGSHTLMSPAIPIASHRASSARACNADGSSAAARSRSSSTAAPPPSGSSPARSSSADSPTSVSQQPIDPQRHRRPSGLTGKCPISPAKPWWPPIGRPPRRCRRRRRPHPTRTPCGQSRTGPETGFGQCAEVGVVADRDRQMVGRATDASASASATSIQPRFGAATTRPSMSRTSPGTDTPQPTRRRPAGGGAVVELFEQHRDVGKRRVGGDAVPRPCGPDTADDRTVEATIATPISSTKISIASAPTDRRRSARPARDGPDDHLTPMAPRSRA